MMHIFIYVSINNFFLEISKIDLLPKKMFLI